MKNKNQAGFSLIELMIALTLGLILVAIATQLLITGQVNYRIQSSASSLQNNGVFGVSYVTKNIRLANHGNAGAMNDESLYGGIVLSAQTRNTAIPFAAAGNLNNILIGTTPISQVNAISANAINNSATITTKSDQLVIMYQAPMDMLTCTGKPLKGPEKTATQFTRGWYVIERYYINKNPNSNTADLHCADARFIAMGESVPQSYKSTTISTVNTLTENYASDAGSMIAKNVEYMRIQLIVRYSNGTTRTLPINEYLAIPITTAAPHRPAVIGINMGWLVRSTEPVSMVEETDYSVLDQSMSVPKDGFMRHVYTTTIALRNGGLGDIIQ